MKIRMLTSLAGVDYALSPGEVTERFDDAEAARLVQADYAVVVIDGAVETATLQPPAETAVVAAPEVTAPPPAETRADDDGKAALVAEAEALGIDVDGRWSVRRLKLEIAAAKAASVEPPAPETAG